MPATGLEPVQSYLLEPESSASANSATRAMLINRYLQYVTNGRYYAGIKVNGKPICERSNPVGLRGASGLVAAIWFNRATGLRED